MGRLSLILKSFSSSSNYEREFFFIIRSMIDLISFRSTVLLGVGAVPRDWAELLKMIVFAEPQLLRRNLLK